MREAHNPGERASRKKKKKRKKKERAPVAYIPT